ncbi:hypothetical protein BGZ54_001595 [Gamsiella multidivaricata]|nr:hypothetical protein BGZ54_001595 [Gamsiella multidivaricata]
MSLGKVLIAIRTILVLLSIVTIAIDCALIKEYIDNQNVAFAWQFYVQMGILGCSLIYFIIVLITLVRQHRRLRYEPAGHTGGCGFIGSVIRAIWVVALAAGILYAVSKPLSQSLRSVFILPYARIDNSAGRDYDQYDTKDLFQCDASSSGGLASKLCTLDRASVIGATVVAVLMLIDVVVSLAYDNQSHSYKNNRDFDHTQHIDLENRTPLTH